MFIPIFNRLRELYPKVHFDLYLESGQEKIFECVPWKEGEDYNHVFHLDFPMSEGSGLTKGQKCCIDEIGIEPIFGIAKLEKKDSPFVALHFQGTALPDSVNCPQDIAGAIWDDVIASGKIPIECHFQHLFHNPKNAKFDFVDRHVRNCEANLNNLIGLIQNSFAFIGVASGPFVAAMSIFPSRTMYLQKRHKLEDYTKLAMARIDIEQGYVKGTVKNWLASL
jgi:hypothetical protein